jgi:hypothetical protein
MIERPFIQLRWLPGFTIVACGTVRHKRILVNSWLRMAINALGSHVFELPIDMAFHTLDSPVATFQRESCTTVIKTNHPIRSIVAFETVIIEISQVLHHKCRVMFPMAINAKLNGGLKLCIVHTPGV